MPKPLRLDVVRPLVRNPRARLAYTVLTVPVAAWLLFAINTWAWHFWPGAYDASLTNGGLHALQHFTFSATSLLIWWTIIDPKPLRSRVSYPFRMLIIIVTMFQNVALGAAITFRDEVLYDFYETRQRLWESARSVTNKRRRVHVDHGRHDADGGAGDHVLGLVG